MANTVERGLVNKSSLTAIGDAIRAKNGTTTQYKPSEMATAISNIKGEDIIVTTGDKYTLKVVNPKNGTITSSLTGKAINNSDGTVSVGLTDNSTYTPYVGYDPGIIKRDFNTGTNVYTVTGTDAQPTEIVDNKGFARVYMEVSTYPYLFFNSTFSGDYMQLYRASGKIFIAGLKNTYPYIFNIGNLVTAFFDPTVITEYPGMTFYSSSDTANLRYLSLPSWRVDGARIELTNNKNDSIRIKYMDLGSISSIKELNAQKVPLNIILRKADGIVTYPSSISSSIRDNKIPNLYVPSSLIPSYKQSNWKNIVTSFVALEGSKYEDPYAFLDEIPT